ncbi:MAG TPA: porphobilinogen synthase, partial [Lacipirellulaceae bacterium]|nr:porphobilinogen synthase [Lacipirellulaceae bacterium]
MPDSPSSPTPWGQYPQTRLRRLRRYDWARRMVAENELRASDLILPLFVHEGDKRQEPIASMPGVFRLSIDLLTEIVGRAATLGIPAIALFPATEPAKKTEDAAEAYNSQNL